MNNGNRANGKTIFVADLANGEFKITEPSSDRSDWLVVRQVSLSINKDEFISNEFVKDFPFIKLSDDQKNVQSISALASRSTALMDWFILKSAEYAEKVDLPLFLEGLVDARRYKMTEDKIFQINKIEADRSNALNEASQDYQNKRKTINDRFDAQKLNITTQDKIARILTYTTQILPISLLYKIENISFQIPDPALESLYKRQYAREILLTYQRELIRTVQQDEKFDLDNFVKLNMLK